MAFEDYTPEEVQAIVARYEFLAEYVDYIKIIDSDGCNSKLHHERSGVDELNDAVDQLMEHQRELDEDAGVDEEEEDEEYGELRF